MSTLQTARATETDQTLTTARALNSFANYERLITRVSDAFGSEVRASWWLSTPNAELNGESPLQAAMKDGYDLRTLEPMLVRIEHGVQG